MRKNVPFISALIALSICSSPAVQAERATVTNSVKTRGKTLTTLEVRNAIYRMTPWEAGDPDTFVKLKNGSWQKGQDSISVQGVALGDLNRDGTTDAAAVYYTSGGGTGYFGSITAFVNKNGRLMAVDNKVLGDRVGLRALKIKNGVIFADVTSHGPSDGACCPTVKRTAKYTLKGHTLSGPDTMY